MFVAVVSFQAPSSCFATRLLANHEKRQNLVLAFSLCLQMRLLPAWLASNRNHVEIFKCCLDKRTRCSEEAIICFGSCPGQQRRWNHQCWCFLRGAAARWEVDCLSVDSLLVIWANANANINRWEVNALWLKGKLNAGRVERSRATCLGERVGYWISRCIASQAKGCERLHCWSGLGSDGSLCDCRLLPLLLSKLWLQSWVLDRI